MHRRSQSGSLVIPPRKGPVISQAPKKPAISAVDQGQSSADNIETTPIADFPSPPVQIVSCRHAQAGELIPLPQLSTAPVGEIPTLALQKIKQCMRICDFSDAKSDAISKETKKNALTELIDLYSNPKYISRLTRECHSQMIEMFATNVFRPLPNIPRALLLSDEVTFEDSAWPHLNLIYILFLKFLDGQIDPRILQYQITPRFITQLFAVLDFPDDRERTQVKNVITAIFNKVPPQRTLLRIITTSLLSGVPEGVSVNATANLLELFYNFTSNATPPLSPVLITAFERTILPLHLLSRLQSYHPQLVRCVLSMIRKDARLCTTLLKFLITHWPLTLDQKSELFIDEVAQMLEETPPQDISANIGELMERVAFAAESPSMTLSEKALGFMLNPRVQVAITEQPEQLIRTMFPALFRVAREHWHRNVQVKALEVMNALMELSPDVFRMVAAEFKQKAIAEFERKRAKKAFWEQVAAMASANDETISPETVEKDMMAYFGAQRNLKSSRRKSDRMTK